MDEIHVDTWLYGELARYGGDASQGSFAHLQVSLEVGSTVKQLLEFLRMPSEARGITFINGNLSAMPGIQPDLDHILQDDDRAAFFDLHAMWPFQYRFGVATIPEMSDALQKKPGGGIQHSYKK